MGLFYFRYVLLIADSGSTKTDWVGIDQTAGVELKFQTEGFNPMIVDTDYIVRALLDSELASHAADVEEIHFYGAGASNAERGAVLQKSLSQVFPKASINVNHDLLGAARAACGNENGVSIILGTGSNACLFRHGEIQSETISLGYLLGDEGSGCDLGKRLMRAYVYKELDSDLSEEISSRFGLSPHQFVTKLYTESLKNRFLASFAPFCVEHKKHPQISDIIETSLLEFVRHHVTKYDLEKGERINAVGSIAWFLKEELRHVLEGFNLELGNVVKKPIHELIKFHSDYAL